MNKRAVIIGLDGVPFRLIKRFSEIDVMPATEKLIKDGIFKPMESSIPEVSSVAWSSIITGKNPGEHGIFGFTDIPKGTYRLSFPNFINLKAPPFWQNDFGGKSIIINVPSTFPVKPMNGIHISGFVSLDLDRSVYPKKLKQKLIELNYQIDVDASKAYESINIFLKDLDKTLKSRIALYRDLWKEDWKIFMLVFTGTDRLSHFLWSAYEDESHKYHEAFLEYFRQIDSVIGEIAGRISDNDLLILLSDHGFELLKKDININGILKQAGFLKLKPETQRGYSSIDFGTKAFALDPARIYIHLKNKYPRGSVEANDYGQIVEELEAIFMNFELEGNKIVKRIYRKEPVYTGPYIVQAPDLNLLPNEGINFRANIKEDKLFDESIFTGKHTQHDAFLLVVNCFEKNRIPDAPTVTDVYGIIDGLRAQS